MLATILNVTVIVITTCVQVVVHGMFSELEYNFIKEVKNF